MLCSMCHFGVNVKNLWTCPACQNRSCRHILRCDVCGLGKAHAKEKLCPICGERVRLIGRTTDKRLIGSCQDAFTLAQWEDDTPEQTADKKWD